ncbi:hypothetical protein ONS95_010325 [Cadophora gregata]|uniref:uncharacterized protein n=1 Tax=Cadophora gregata TaxID=51156 RepID=UPI0026DB69C7|nr:uncharacterized protein ONS95_010325 [Cadophora gregata]KAK0122061.1 hypothetical protein ONS95_010325 [Cadophora gregata]KAK0127536.1 hypothetical protein ONS96_007071 [Cadophora gregata f. sp. sojae]
MPTSLGQAIPNLLLREHSTISAPVPNPYNLNSAWAEAEIWIFGQLRSGMHPGAINNLIARLSNLLNQGDPYAHDFLEACRRILKNLARNGLFQELPGLEEYEKLVEGGNWPLKRVTFTIMMCNRYADNEMLRSCSLDSYTAQILDRPPPIDPESRRILQLEEENVIKEVENHRRITEQRLRRYTDIPKPYSIGLYGDKDVFDGPLRQVNLFSSGPTGLNRGNMASYLDKGEVGRDLAWKKSLRDRSPSPSRLVHRAIDENRVLRGGGSVEELPDHAELLAIMDDDMLI